MAASKEADDEVNAKDVVIYIMPQRIQKKMLQDIKNGVNRTRLRVREKYGEGVSHIITQYTEREQVLRQLQRDGAPGINSDADLEQVKVVTLAWLSACLKAGRTVAVEEKHIVKCKQTTQQIQEGAETSGPEQGRAHQPAVPLWACQRVTPLQHHNHKLTGALEILEKHADLRNEGSDNSRALAFRRASCVMKSLPFRVERLAQVEGLKDIGGHSLKVIQSILEDGFCEEVQSISNSKWFKLMKEFTSVFGVGSATAKKWIDRGWKSISDVRAADHVSKDERVTWGLAFHEDLTSPVSGEEADTFVRLVQTEAERIAPGVITTLTGGFRRGKRSGHDVDILLSHPKEGEEKEVLPALLQALGRKGLVLMGRREASTYTQEVLEADFAPSPKRGQMDHFEKWLGICKFEKNVTPSSGSDNASKSAEVGCSAVKKLLGTDAEESDSCTSERYRSDFQSGTDDSPVHKGGTPARNKPKPTAESTTSEKEKEDNPKNLETGRVIGSPVSHSKTQVTEGEAEDCESSGFEPQLKRRRTVAGERPSPRELAASERSWRARRVDLIVAPYSQYYYALVGWTGNKQFNRDLRLYAQKELGMKLTSHGLWDLAKQTAIPARSEMEVFDNLKLEYREPAHRNC